MKKLLVLSLCALSFFGVNAQNEVTAKAKNASLSWETQDKNFSWNLNGRFYFDGATYLDDKTDLGSGSELRDFRLGVKVKFFHNWFAKIDVGLAGNETAAKDIFLQYNFDKQSYFRVGHYAEPFGLDYMESSKSVKYMTPNSSTEAFAPGRKVGLEYVKWGQKYWFAGGLFGDGDLANSQSGDEGFALTGRFVFNPITKPGSILHFGVAGSYRTADAAGFDSDGNENAKTIRYRSRAETHIERRRFIDAKVTDADYQAKYAVEFVGATGPLALQSEYFSTNVERKNGLKSYSADGWYVQVAWLIKGGEYKYSNKWARLSDPGVGSWELVARYNSTDLNDTESNIDLDENALNGKENFGLIQTRLQFAF